MSTTASPATAAAAASCWSSCDVGDEFTGPLRDHYSDRGSVALPAAPARRGPAAPTTASPHHESKPTALAPAAFAAAAAAAAADASKLPSGANDVCFVDDVDVTDNAALPTKRSRAAAAPTLPSTPSLKCLDPFYSGHSVVDASPPLTLCSAGADGSGLVGVRVGAAGGGGYPPPPPSAPPVQTWSWYSNEPACQRVYNELEDEEEEDEDEDGGGFGAYYYGGVGSGDES